MINIPHLLWVAAEEEESRGEAVEAVDGAQVLEALLLRQDEHHRVVPVPAARVHLQNGLHLVKSSCKLL